jgi:hypothetical protein
MLKNLLKKAGNTTTSPRYVWAMYLGGWICFDKG